MSIRQTKSWTSETFKVDSGKNNDFDLIYSAQKDRISRQWLKKLPLVAFLFVLLVFIERVCAIQAFNSRCIRVFCVKLLLHLLNIVTVTVILQEYLRGGEAGRGGS